MSLKVMFIDVLLADQICSPLSEDVAVIRINPFTLNYENLCASHWENSRIGVL